MGAGFPNQGLSPGPSWALAQIPFLGTRSDTSICSHDGLRKGWGIGVLTEAPQGNPRPRRLCCLPDVTGAFREVTACRASVGPWCLGTRGSSPAASGCGTCINSFPSSSPASQHLLRGSNFAQPWVLWVGPQARRALAGVVALGVDPVLVGPFIDSGLPLTFISVHKGNERVMAACSHGQPLQLGVGHISWCGSIWKALPSPSRWQGAFSNSRGGALWACIVA